MGVGEVYLQRLVFFGADPVGLARPDQALFERLVKEEAEILAEAEAEARRLGVTFTASGAASEPARVSRRRRATIPGRCAGVRGHSCM